MNKSFYFDELGQLYTPDGVLVPNVVSILAGSSKKYLVNLKTVENRMPTNVYVNDEGFVRIYNKYYAVIETFSTMDAVPSREMVESFTVKVKKSKKTK